MKLFLVKLISFILIQAAIFAGLYIKYDDYLDRHYLAVTLDKHERLEDTPPPRIIFVGGSSLAFGLHSKEIEKALKMPVVNMGIYVGLGLPFMLNEVRDSLRPGDVVVVTPEYDIFGQIFQPLEVTTMLQFRPESYKYLNLEQKKQILDYLHLYVGLVTRTSVKQMLGTASGPLFPYVRSGFNEFGDLVIHYNHPEVKPDKTLNVMIHIDRTSLDKNIEALKDFVKYCNSNGIIVVAGFTPVSKNSYKRNYDQIHKVEVAIRQIPGLIVIDSPEDYTYDWDLFFDRPYHLTGKGGEQRTRTLIKALERAGIR